MHLITLYVILLFRNTRVKHVPYLAFCALFCPIIQEFSISDLFEKPM